MNSIHKQCLPVICLLATIIISSLAFAGGVEDLLVLKISAQDQRAIIKTSDGNIRIIKPGDFLLTSSKFTEIAADRVIIEEKKEKETETVIIRFVDGKQKIERIKKAAEHSPVCSYRQRRI
jgi:hypothetical protein